MHPTTTVRTSARHQRHGFVSAGDLQMYYELGGEGSPLLLLHGGCATIETSFHGMRPILREHHKVLALEQQGHGHTRDLDRPLSFRQMVEDTATALDQLRFEAVHVFGWGDGGIVALGVALEYPELVDKVAVLGAGPEVGERMRAATADNARLGDFRRHYEQVAPDPADWAGLVGKVQDNWQAWPGWDEGALRKLAAPLMVMVGDREIPALEHALGLFRLVPRGRLAVLPGCDHSAPVTHAAWVAAMLLDFYAG